MKISFKKISQLTLSFMLLSVLLPVLASAATYVNINRDSDFYKGTIFGTISSDVYKEGVNAKFSVYKDYPLTVPVPLLSFHAVFNKDLSVNGAAYFDFTAEIPKTKTNSYGYYYQATYNNLNSAVGGVAGAIDGGGGGGGGGSGSTAPNIVLNASSYTMQIGETTTVSATAEYYDDFKSDVTPYTTFTLMDPTIATITYAGLITGSRAGSTVLNATYSGKTVTANVYVSSKASTSSGGSGGGGGGGSVSNDGVTTISVASDGSVNAFSLSNALAVGTVVLKLEGNSVLLPTVALIGFEGKTITITNNNGSYILPLSVLKLEDLAKQLGVDVNDFKINISITKVSGTTADAVHTAVIAAGGELLADAIDFNVEAIEKNGKKVMVNLGDTYISRSILIPKVIDTSKTTGVLFNDAANQVSFVPTMFSTTEEKTLATIKRNGNSIYTVIKLHKSYPDLTAHWAKADVELLANKLVVEGSTADTFEPERNITRAEFATLIVRSLGIESVSKSSNFIDVNDAWYTSSITAAVKAGIINGYEDHTFHPDEQISREELAAMIIRAMVYANISTAPSDPQSVLSRFNDSNQIVWAHDEIAKAVNSGIMNGLTDTSIASSKKATRAQAAVMLKRFLTVAEFIN
ncbi:S-layer homology domain-containing protein [Paenibacillus periandrae]|uniref:S-layer homology domain-containing protein n=1 Tax=Paenibacillus periandrae TaxID=1761741 RepID=UPI001F098CDC|nr:S-layer homology domain-containing protein [Paenibacillus periandrae]